MVGVSNVLLAGDLFNLYVGFEILRWRATCCSPSAAPRRASVGSPTSSSASRAPLIFLAAIGLIYAATGTVNMAQLAARSELPVGTQLLLHSLLLIAFCIKAAAFPLSAWLPDKSRPRPRR